MTDPELSGWILLVSWVLSQHEGWDVYYQVGVFSVDSCHPRSGPLGLIWLKCSIRESTLACWFKPGSQQVCPPFPPAGTLFPCTLPQASARPPPGPPPASTMSRDTPRWDFQPVPLPGHISLQPSFLLPSKQWLPGNTNLQVKKPTFSETSVILKWFGVRGWSYF